MANDHYVPQCLLRAFGTKRKKQTYVHVFDKWTEKSFRSNVSNVLAEKDFHTVELNDGEKVSVEERFTVLENAAAPVLEKLREHRHLGALSDAERETLVFFVTVQFIRTKKYRDMFLQMDEVLGKALERMGASWEQVENLEPIRNENDLKQFVLGSMSGDVQEFFKYFANKAVFLMYPTDGHHFYISDHPVVMANQNEFSGRGNIGLAVKGIEIYVPLAHDLLLSMHCHETANEMLGMWQERKQTLRRMKSLSVLGVGAEADRAREALKRLNHDEEDIEEVLDALATGGCIPASVDNVTYCNDLQVRHSGRYVISRIDNFELARLILKDYPDLKHGTQMQDGSQIIP